jgi:broad specificity phosphatase PhoE
MDIDLSEKGLAQKEKMINYLSKLEKLDVVISSDLTRCRTIAEPIAKRKNLKLVISKNIRELNFGAWEGLTFDEIGRLDEDYQKQWLRNPYEYAPPNGETLNQCLVRATDFLEPYQGENALIVTHGGIIGALMHYYLKRDFNIPDAGTCIKLDIRKKDWTEINNLF